MDGVKNINYDELLRLGETTDEVDIQRIETGALVRV